MVKKKKGLLGRLFKKIDEKIKKKSKAKGCCCCECRK